MPTTTKKKKTDWTAVIAAPTRADLVAEARRLARALSNETAPENAARQLVRESLAAVRRQIDELDAAVAVAACAGDPAPEESDGAKAVRLGAAVIAAANVAHAGPHWELADLGLRMRLDTMEWIASLGRAEAFGLTAVEALEKLVVLVKRTTLHHSEG